MKRIYVGSLCILLIVVTSVLAAAGDVESKEEAETELPVKVHLKRTEPRTVATMRHTGSFEALPNVIGSLMEGIAEGNHLVAGPIMAVYYNDPRQVAEEELLWEVMVPVARPGRFGSVESGKMGFKYLDVMFVAYTYHIGPCENVAESYDLLFSWVARNEYKILGAPMEVYWSDPEQTPPEKLVTEIWVPVEEKKIPGGVIR
jgi:effector-binding domain-containing protein